MISAVIFWKGCSNHLYARYDFVCCNGADWMNFASLIYFVNTCINFMENVEFCDIINHVKELLWKQKKK